MKRPIKILFISVLILSLGCSKITTKPVTHAAKLEVPPLPHDLAQVETTSRTVMQNPSESKLRLVTSSLLFSTLQQVFGSGVEQNAILNDMIVTQAAALGGGPCDPYNGAECGTGTDKIFKTQLPVIPSFTSARAALIQRACDRLVSLDQAVAYATSRVIIAGNVSSTQNFPGDAQINAVFELFYSDRSISPEIALALKQLIESIEGEKKYAAIEGWRFLFLTLCISPGWQIL